MTRNEVASTRRSAAWSFMSQGLDHIVEANEYTESAEQARRPCRSGVFEASGGLARRPTAAGGRWPTTSGARPEAGAGALIHGRGVIFGHSLLPGLYRWRTVVYRYVLVGRVVFV